MTKSRHAPSHFTHPGRTNTGVTRSLLIAIGPDPDRISLSSLAVLRELLKGANLEIFDLDPAQS